MGGSQGDGMESLGWGRVVDEGDEGHGQGQSLVRGGRNVMSASPQGVFKELGRQVRANSKAGEEQEESGILWSVRLNNVSRWLMTWAAGFEH